MALVDIDSITMPPGVLNFVNEKLAQRLVQAIREQVTSKECCHVCLFVCCYGVVQTAASFGRTPQKPLVEQDSVGLYSRLGKRVDQHLLKISSLVEQASAITLV